MDAFQRNVIDLLKAGLMSQQVQLNADFDWSLAYRLGRAHGVLSMLYYGALNNSLNVPQPVWEKMEAEAVRSVVVDQNQLHELCLLQERFFSNGIDFVPLKGMVLKQLYPRTDMRSMGDADILIKTEQYTVIRPVMEQLGYEFVLESDHELVWRKTNALLVELHKRLIPSYNEDYYAYFGDGWRLAQPSTTVEHSMRDEDQFIYLFTHYAKHYRDAGIGIRHLIDLYVFLQAKPVMDMAYIERELDRLQLLTFFRNTLATLEVWFNGGVDTPMSDFITTRIFGSGSFGTRENHNLSEGVKITKTASGGQVKLKKLLSLIFPSVKILEVKYDILRKMPFLLPIIWVFRWVSAPFKKGVVRGHWEDASIMTDENVASYQEQLNYVGLDFRFGE